MPEDTAAADTALDTGSAPADTQVDQSAPAADTAPDASTAVDTQQDQQTGSLTPPTPVRAPNGSPSAQDVADPHKELETYRTRYNDVRTYANKVANENQTYRKQWEGLDPNRVREVMAEHEKREKASKLNPWNRGHPENSRFQQSQNKYESYKQALGMAASEEEKAIINRTLGSQFSPQEAELLQKAETYRRDIQNELVSDPEAFVSSRVDTIINQRLAEYDSFQGARTTASQMLSDPGNQALIQKYAPQMADIMDGKIPARELAFEHARMKAELESLKARLGEQVETESTAEAQNAARRGPGRPPGSPNRPRQTTAPARDPIAILAERKIYPGDPQFARELHKINNPQR